MRGQRQDDVVQFGSKQSEMSYHNYGLELHSSLKSLVFVIELAVPRLIGLVLRRGPDRLVPEVISGI